MSLIKKLSEKLSEELKKVSAKGALSEKLKKVFAKGAIGLVLASAITLAGCDFGANVDNNNNQGIGDSQGEIELPNEKPNESENEHTFSQLTLDMLNNEYYKNLIDEKKNYFLSDENKFAPIPYGFLEDEGIDVELTKSNFNFCQTYIYTTDENSNNLYLSLAYKNNNTHPSYHDFYTLEYSLSENEMNDFKYLLENNYFESSLFIQYLSYRREPEILSKATMDALSYTRTKRNVSNYTTPYFNSPFFNLIGFSTTDNTLTYVVTDTNLDKSIQTTEMRYMKLSPINGEQIELYDDYMYYGPYEVDFATEEDKNYFETYSETITKYTPNTSIEANYLFDELNNENTND